MIFFVCIFLSGMSLMGFGHTKVTLLWWWWFTCVLPKCSESKWMLLSKQPGEHTSCPSDLVIIIKSLWMGTRQRLVFLLRISWTLNHCASYSDPYLTVGNAESCWQDGHFFIPSLLVSLLSYMHPMQNLCWHFPVTIWRRGCKQMPHSILYEFGENKYSLQV